MQAAESEILGPESTAATQPGAEPATGSDREVPLSPGTDDQPPGTDDQRGRETRRPQISTLTAELMRHGRTLHLIKSQMATEIPTGLDWGALSLLLQIAAGGPYRQQGLAACTALDPSTVSRHVAQLVRAGLVERQPDPSDGRAAQLAATDEGRAVMTALSAHRDELFRQVLAGWDDEDLATLLRLVTRLNDDVDALRARTAPGAAVRSPKPRG